MTTFADRPEMPDAPPPPPPPPGPAPEAGMVEEERSSSFGLVFLIGLIVLLGLGPGRGAVITLIGFVILIFFHELGHYLTARRAGMKVTQFFIGFGPRIWSFHRGETEYGIKAIPAGAYVKVIGMSNLEEVEPEDERRTYRQGTYLRRMSVVLGGPAMNLVLGFIGLLVMYMGFGFVGFDTLVDGPDPAEWSIGQVLPEDDLGQPSAAVQLGVEEGDKIIEINGNEIVVWADVIDVVSALDPGDRIDVSLERGTDIIDATSTLGTAIDSDTNATRAQIGVGRALPDYDVDPVGFGDALTSSIDDYGSIMRTSVVGISQLGRPSTWANILGFDSGSGTQEATASRSTGSGSASAGEETQFMGPIGIVASGSGVPLEGLLLLWVMINAFVGLLNLVPLLPFDGGHAVVATYERIRSIGGRRHMADISRLMPITYAVVFAMVILGSAIAYRDIERILL